MLQVLNLGALAELEACSVVLGRIELFLRPLACSKHRFHLFDGRTVVFSLLLTGWFTDTNHLAFPQVSLCFIGVCSEILQTLLFLLLTVCEVLLTAAAILFSGRRILFLCHRRVLIQISN